MAPVRRQTERLAQDVRELLNRPDEDDLFAWPDRYYEALSRAHRYYRQKIAQHAPGILTETRLITSNDNGASFQLDDHHYGELEVWEPPGPPSGIRLYPALPESSYLGYFVSGTDIKLTLTKSYSPGLYVRGVFATVADLSDDQQHSLPAYVEDAMTNRAAYYMAMTPGFLGDPSQYRRMAAIEWAGDPEDPSDMGVLGTIKRLGANEGIETAAGLDEMPWYHRMSSGG